MRLGVVTFLVIFLAVGCVSHPDCFAARCTPVWDDIDLSLYDIWPLAIDPSFPTDYSDEGEKEDRWKSVQPAQPQDYWELRRNEIDTQPLNADKSPNALLQHQAVVRIGEKCSHALDKDRCVVAFDALRSENGIGYPRYLKKVNFYIVSNRGDEIFLWDTKEKILGFLGTINSNEEAVLVVTADEFAGERLAKGVYEKAKGAVRQVDGEYELVVIKPADDIRGGIVHLLRVSPLGQIRVLRQTPWATR